MFDKLLVLDPTMTRHILVHKFMENIPVLLRINNPFETFRANNYIMESHISSPINIRCHTIFQVNNTEIRVYIFIQVQDYDPKFTFVGQLIVHI